MGNSPSISGGTSETAPDNNSDTTNRRCQGCYWNHHAEQGNGTGYVRLLRVNATLYVCDGVNGVAPLSTWLSARTGHGSITSDRKVPTYRGSRQTGWISQGKLVDCDASPGATTPDGSTTTTSSSHAKDSTTFAYNYPKSEDPGRKSSKQ